MIDNKEKTAIRKYTGLRALNKEACIKSTRTPRGFAWVRLRHYNPNVKSWKKIYSE